MNAAPVLSAVAPLPVSAFVVEWDANKIREVEEAKNIYRRAKFTHRPIVDMEGNPVQVFKPALLGIRILPRALTDHQFAVRILNENGDDTVIWDSTKPAEVEEAAAKFNDYLDKGWRAYAVAEDGKSRRRVRRFHAALQEIEFEDGERSTAAEFAKKFSETQMLPRTYPG